MQVFLGFLQNQVADLLDLNMCMFCGSLGELLRTYILQCMQYFYVKKRKSIQLLCLPIDIHRRNALWHQLNALALAEHALNLYRNFLLV